MEKEKTKWTKKKIILEVFEWIGVVFCVLVVAFIAVFASNKPSSKSSGSIFGFETRLVVSGSMEGSDDFYKNEGKDFKIKKISVGSAVFIDSIPVNDVFKDNAHKEYTDTFKDYISKISVNDVLTFTPMDSPTVPITHRVINIETRADGKVMYTTHGDANEDGVNEKFYAENIIGKVIGSSKFVGDLYNNFFTKKWAVAIVIVTPCLAVMTFEIIKIFKIVKEDKKQKLALESNSLGHKIKSINELVDSGVLTREEADAKIAALKEKEEKKEETNK